MKHKVLVEGDVNFLGDNEILISQSEGYTILRERKSGVIKTYVVVPLDEFNSKPDSK